MATLADSLEVSGISSDVSEVSGSPEVWNGLKSTTSGKDLDTPIAANGFGTPPGFELQ